MTLPLETAVEHLADAHKQLEVLSINNPEAGRNGLLTRTETSRGALGRSSNPGTA